MTTKENVTISPNGILSICVLDLFRIPGALQVSWDKLGCLQSHAKYHWINQNITMKVQKGSRIRRLINSIRQICTWRNGERIGIQITHLVFHRSWAALTFQWAVWAVKGGTNDAGSVARSAISIRAGTPTAIKVSFITSKSSRMKYSRFFCVEYKREIFVTGLVWPW